MRGTPSTNSVVRVLNLVAELLHKSPATDCCEIWVCKGLFPMVSVQCNSEFEVIKIGIKKGRKKRRVCSMLSIQIAFSFKVFLNTILCRVTDLLIILYETLQMKMRY